MDGRVSKVEAYVETVRDELSRLRDGQDRILDKLNLLPTRTELNTWKWQWLAASIAIFAVVVTILFHGLNFLKG